MTGWFLKAGDQVTYKADGSLGVILIRARPRPGEVDGKSRRAPCNYLVQLDDGRRFVTNGFALECDKTRAKEETDMPKFRKKPVVVDAEQWFPGKRIPGVCTGECSGLFGAPPQQPHVHTLEGAMSVSPGDWIITGVNGEVYSCKDNIFRKTYEEVVE
jgi:hypothetical protein